MLVRAILAACLCIGAAPLARSAAPDAITVDGGRYYGPLVNGKLQGKGRIEWENGIVYEGEFANGLMSGQGEIRHPDGRKYRGEFARGLYEGKGRFETPRGEVYEGEFRKNEFTGTGRSTRKDGAHYEGGFRDWSFHGQGRYTDAQGNTWEGNFVDGRLEGKGRSTSRMGAYEGEFKQWVFSGAGVLRLANGDVYEGGFANGTYEGKGTLTYAKPGPDGRKQDTGVWRYGSLQGEREQANAGANVEIALYAQKDLLQKAFAALQPREPGRINLYLLAVAGDGKQEVFRREVEFVQKAFAQRFGTGGRSIGLVNSRNTVATAPMATVTSLRDALKAIAARMDREQDILFLFLTSHGSKEHEFILSQNGMDLPDLPAKALGALLKDSGIRWKVVVVSACYSGGFIEPLHDERTLVITAARHDRTSFGCADENDFTYFGRAYFKEALPGSGSFQDAFRKAEVLVREWERKDAADAAKAGTKPGKDDKESESLPQISTGNAVDAHLKRWWAQSPR